MPNYSYRNLLATFLLVLLFLGLAAGSASAATKDANKDGKTDFLLRHEGFPGNWYIAYMNGPGSHTLVDLPGLPPQDGYYAAATGDFDGDGFMDVLVRDGLGINYIYLIANGAVKQYGTASGMPLPPSDPVNTIELRKDLDDDGKTDLVLVTQTGLVYVCYMNGVNVKAPCTKFTGYPAALTIFPSITQTAIETGGVYKTGEKVQFLAKRMTMFPFKFERWVYTLNFSTKTIAGARFNALETVASTSWQPMGSFDYDNDGLAEIVMRNNLNGDWMAVKVNGSSVVKTTKLFNEIRHAAAVKPYSLFSDLRGDGKRQMVLKHNSLNTYVYYEFDGNSVTGSGSVNLPTIPVSLTMVGVLSN